MAAVKSLLEALGPEEKEDVDDPSADPRRRPSHLALRARYQAGEGELEFKARDRFAFRAAVVLIVAIVVVLTVGFA
ncbi:hypothetical protein BH11MYX3_BH11MYX3_28320 [soil metagenome]